MSPANHSLRAISAEWHWTARPGPSLPKTEPGDEAVPAPKGTVLARDGLLVLHGDFAGADGAHKELVVSLALVGIGLSETHQRIVHSFAPADIAGQPGSVTHFGVGPSQRPAAHRREIEKHRALQLFKRYG